MDQEQFIAEAESLGSAELLRFVFETFGPKAAIGTSLQKTGSVIIDLASKTGIEYSVFFIDTMCNYDETIDLIGKTENHYGIKIERLFPDPKDIEKLYHNYGQHPFYSNVGRERCCHIRKKLPLDKKLVDLDVWISGLRADQSEHRKQSTKKVSIIKHKDRQIIKINPLLDWSEEQIDEYIKNNNVPYNELYDFESAYGEKFKQIGCKPCHIPVKTDMPKRAGKFPWEPSHKECGLHINGDGI